MSQEKLPTKIQYVDVPAVAEIFADSVHTMAFDGQTFRVEFCVTRLDDPRKAGTQITGKRLTACRVVLSPGAALELSTKLGRMLGAMAKQAAATKGTQSAVQQAPGQSAATKPN